ncbi:hypothetical protein G6011_06296 [Alternaria panax]|uniref:Uncharacterized protein n=1 Tax=Alternaria panax TaxID=48097 RepID=A0AAD4FG88_9PLEO|nr:hypothetical protein G6011_06296 [Alternaria panax]
MNTKPRSQIGRIGHAPPRTRTAAFVTPIENDQQAARHGASGIVHPSPSKLPSFQGDTEHRRSLLPQPGQQRYNTRSSILPEVSDPYAGPEDTGEDSREAQHQPEAVLTTQEVQVPGAVSGRLRPRSTYQAGTPSSQRTENADKTSAPRSMLPPASVSKLAAPQAGLSRSQSMRKPAAVSQPVQSSGHSGHSRTQSTSTISAPRQNVKRSNTISERPKSLQIAPSRTTKNSSTSTDTLPGTTRTSMRSTGLSRTASTRTKPTASSSLPSTGPTPRTEELLATQSRRKELALEEQKKTTRPAFSTLQQHFTPRKVGKAPTATFINSTSQATSYSLPPETVSLQSELLQLHLLHRSSAQECRRWEISAKRSLHIKFEEVANLYQVMLENERAAQEQKNLQSLVEWSSGGLSAGLVEHIHILSEPLHELPSLVEPGGRLQRLVGEFGHWLSWVQDIRSARHNHGRAKSAFDTIEGLGDTWKAENAALSRKLTVLARDLDRLASPTPGSSIACMVEACKSILHGILDELQTMQKIEAEVASREKEWVEDRLQVIAQDIRTESVDADGQSAAWRM